MRRVLKYPLQVGENTISINGYAKFLKVAFQYNNLFIWAEVQDSPGVGREHRFLVYVTGNEIPKNDTFAGATYYGEPRLNQFKYFDSAISDRWVLHVYESVVK